MVGDRVDYDSEHTTPPNVGEDLEELAAEMEGTSRQDLEDLMDKMLDADEQQLAHNPATPPANPLFAQFTGIPEEDKQEVSLYVGETDEYVELGITFAERFYRPWIGKWRSNGGGEVFYPIDVADGGFPGYKLVLDEWPGGPITRRIRSRFLYGRPLTEEEKSSVNDYLSKKEEILSEYDVEEVPEQLAIPRMELEEAFSHLDK